MRFVWGTVIVGLLGGCGPVVGQNGPDEADSTAGGTEPGQPDPAGTSDPGGTSTTSANAGEPGPDDGSSSTTDREPQPDPLLPDEALCLDYCVNVSDAPACTLAGEGCYTSCIDRLGFADERGCGEVERDVLACESEATIDDWCWSSTDCRDAYINADFCRGFCSYFDGYPGGGGSPDACDWRSDCLDDTVSVEMTCAVGDDPSCQCWVDGVVVGECTHEGSIGAFECGGDDLHVLNGCCEPFFREVMQ